MTVARLRVLALVHRHLIPPEKIEDGVDITAEPWRTEYDVITTLRGLGHEVLPRGVHDDPVDGHVVHIRKENHIAAVGELRGQVVARGDPRSVGNEPQDPVCRPGVRRGSGPPGG